MLKRHTSEWLLGWRAFFAIEPWGDKIAWARFANLMSLIANIHRKKGRPSFRPEDFMPHEPRAASKKQSVQEIKMRLLAAFGKLKPKKKKKKRKKR